MRVPRIELDPMVHLCARHREPFRDGWPAGVGVCMVKLFEHSIADERIVAACPKDSTGLARADSLDAVLLEHSPLCCFLGDECMTEIYRDAGKGHRP